MSKTGNQAHLSEWLARYRFRMQTGALILIIGSSLILYPALNAKQDALAIMCFVVIALNMGIAVWVS